jgi:hypothetical protein
MVVDDQENKQMQSYNVHYLHLHRLGMVVDDQEISKCRTLMFTTYICMDEEWLWMTRKICKCRAIIFTTYICIDEEWL